MKTLDSAIHGASSSSLNKNYSSPRSFPCHPFSCTPSLMLLRWVRRGNTIQLQKKLICTIHNTNASLWMLVSTAVTQKSLPHWIRFVVAYQNSTTTASVLLCFLFRLCLEEWISFPGPFVWSFHPVRNRAFSFASSKSSKSAKTQQNKSSPVAQFSQKTSFEIELNYLSDASKSAKTHQNSSSSVVQFSQKSELWN